MKKVILSALFMFAILGISSVTFAAVSQIPNAHETGIEGQAGTLNKNKSGNPTWAEQSIHGSFQNNTNACSSCHKAHTAVDGNASRAKLVFTDSRSELCFVCHDGSSASQLSGGNNAGTFDGTMGASKHDVGSATIGSAPGGGGQGGATTTLACSSCHNVHGSDSVALLKTSIGDDTIDAKTTSKIGKVFPAVPNTYQGTDFVIVKETVGSTGIWATGYYKDLVDNGFPAADGSGYVADTKLNVGDTVYMTYWWNPNRDTATGTGGYGQDAPMWKVGDLPEGDILRSEPSDAAVIDYKHGLAYGTAINAAWGSAPATGLALANQFNVGISVQPYRAEVDGVMTTFNRSYFDSSYKNFNTYAGRNMSRFCAQCHYDKASYQRSADPGSKTVTGQGPRAHANLYRHSTFSDSYSCTRCHFAHGTDATIMRDSTGSRALEATRFAGDLPAVEGKAKKTGGVYSDTDALAYMTDTNASSANLRMPGKTVCASCHIGPDGSHSLPSYGGIDQESAREWQKTYVPNQHWNPNATGNDPGANTKPMYPYKTGRGLPNEVPF